MRGFQLLTLGLFFCAIYLLSSTFYPIAATSGVPILMYHYIGNNPNPKDTARDTLSVAPDKFDAQMGYLASHGYTPITLNTLYGIFAHVTSVSKPIVLTFDDGYIDFYINAFPILQKYNFHAVSFIPTGLMNQGYYMSWDQIRQINSSGLIDFEAHTVSHSNLPSLNATRITQELTNSKNTLQSVIGHNVNFVAYPNGTSNQLVRSIASKLYVSGVGTWYGKATYPSMNMPRIRITGQMSLSQFASRI